MKRLIFILPLAAFLLIGIYLMIGLGLDPHKLPNMLEGKPVPAFSLPGIEGRDDKGFSSNDLIGSVALVNVFGSWCVACRVEHPYLMQLKKTNAVTVHAIDWREPDRQAGPAWLKRHGDPYALIGDDPNSRAAIAFGVTGAPETFVVDKKGIIRYKHVGPITDEVWTNTLKPLVEHLKGEGG